ncbi:MAG: hypothetical protein IKR57_01760 [Bacilli bacterium]|nr:hypothetical protein [Bacilli bacterium]
MSKTLYGHHIETIKGDDYVLFEDYTELQDRIDKAVEYIEDNSTNTYLLKSFDIDILLDILKGDNK